MRGGDEGKVVGEVVSGRGSISMMRSGARNSMGEGLANAASVLATGCPGNIGVSGMGREGVKKRDGGAGGARQLRNVCCSGASCLGLGYGLGLCRSAAIYRKRQAHHLYKMA